MSEDKHFIIFKRPGWVPGTKRSPDDTNKSKTLDVGRDIQQMYPDADVMVVTVTWNGQYWVDTLRQARIERIVCKRYAPDIKEEEDEE